jgi:hypothetical protein
MDNARANIRSIVIDKAVVAGNKDVIVFLNLNNDEAGKCLEMAIKFDHILLVEYLLANFNLALENSNVMAALHNKNTEMVTLLCANGYSIDCSLADLVISNCGVVMFKILFSENLKSFNRQSAISKACSHGKLDILQYIESQYNEDVSVALFYGALHNKLDIVVYVSKTNLKYATEAYLIAILKNYGDITNHLKSLVSHEVANL